MKRFLTIIAAFLVAVSANAQLLPGAKRAGFQDGVTPSGGGGSLSIVHVAKGLSAAANNVAVSLTATSSGNLLVLCVVNDTAAVSSVSDNIGGTAGWTQVFDYHPTTTHLGCWYKKNAPSGINTVTVTATGGAFITAIIHEVQGASTTAPFTTGEFATQVFLSATTNPQTPGLVNGTPASILFAFDADLDQTGNPATLTINGTGTVGTWNLFSSSNSQELNAVANDITSVPNIIVSSSATQVHGWTIPSGREPVAIVAFH
jgi:hypothetical protein